MPTMTMKITDPDDDSRDVEIEVRYERNDGYGIAINQFARLPNADIYILSDTDYERAMDIIANEDANE